MKVCINYRHDIFLGWTAAQGGLLFGFGIAIITGAGPFLSKAFALSDMGLGWDSAQCCSGVLWDVSSREG
jgi:hypothetical protein